MNAETIRILIAKGLTAQDILDVAETLEAAPARSSAAERQARYRERKKADAEACDVTSDVTRDASQRDDRVSLSPPNEYISNPPHTLPLTKSGGRDAFPCPEWCEPTVWADLKRNRKAKRLANTATAHSQFLRDIAKLATDEWPPGEVVRDIAARGWGGAYDPREAGKPNNGRNQKSGNSTASAASAALALLERRGH